MKLFIGLMSGTSMDGIDAALVDCETNQFLDGITSPYSEYCQKKLDEFLQSDSFSAAQLCELNGLIGREFAAAVNQLMSRNQTYKKQVIAIGSHGQTVAHNTQAAFPYTLQLGCPHSIAELTGYQVVADFRTRDVVAGGQGAPFAPIYHQELCKNQARPLALINIGGISNITCLYPDKVIGYDIGPGNCLIDAWIKQHLNLSYDKEGEWASSGKLIEDLLERLLQDPYFARSYPKAIGKEYFSLDWLGSHHLENYYAVDVQTTLVQLTAKTIADNVLKMIPHPNRIIICGGGAYNHYLLKCLENLVGEIGVNTSEIIQVHPDFMEAMMFAWLAEKAISKQALDMKEITGAKSPIILGAIYAAGIDKTNYNEV